MNTQLFQSSSQVVEWLRKIAQPMTDHEDTWLMNTGIVRVGLSKDVLNTLLHDDKYTRNTGTYKFYELMRDGKRYTVRVKNNWTLYKACEFFWDHRTD